MNFWTFFSRSNRLFRLGGEVPHNSRGIRWSRGRVGNHLGSEGGTDVLHFPVLPVRIAILTQREQNQVIRACHEVVHIWWWSGSDNVKFHGNLPTVRVEREIIDILAEGVFDLTANRGQAKDDVCSHCAKMSDTFIRDMGNRVLTHGSWNSDPPQSRVQLKGKHQNIDPSNLGNGNGVRGRQRGIQDPLGASQDLVERGHHGDYVMWSAFSRASSGIITYSLGPGAEPK